MRTVVHDHHFDFAAVICRKKRPQSLRDHFLLVVSGYDHANRLGEIRFRAAAKAVCEPDHNEGAHDHQCRGDNHERPEEFFDAVVNAKSCAAHNVRERFAIALQGRHESIARRAEQRA